MWKILKSLVKTKVISIVNSLIVIFADSLLIQATQKAAERDVVVVVAGVFDTFLEESH